MGSHSEKRWGKNRVWAHSLWEAPGGKGAALMWGFGHQEPWGRGHWCEAVL